MEYLSKVKLSTEPTKTGKRPLISVVAPAYNEAQIIQESLETLCSYMTKLEHLYRWEIVVVNDGSKDETGEIADQFSKQHPQVKVMHHKVNRNLGGALRTGFRNSNGDYVVVLDLDLSYAPDHIEKLLSEIEETDADVVVASPYMKGGRSTKVPFFRLLLSKTINRLMRYASDINLYTFTGMARVYKGSFLRAVNLKANSYDINPEIIQKASILRARIVEIPAHLDWSHQVAIGKQRSSSIKIFKGILTGLMSSFIFRPYMFFLVIGLLLLTISLYVISWIFYHTFSVYPDIAVESGLINDRFSEAVAYVFRARPHSFFVGGITFVVALQFLGIGFLSLQNKRYFDELFHINTSILKGNNE